MHVSIAAVIPALLPAPVPDVTLRREMGGLPGPPGAVRSQDPHGRIPSRRERRENGRPGSICRNGGIRDEGSGRKTVPVPARALQRVILASQKDHGAEVNCRRLKVEQF